MNRKLYKEVWQLYTGELASAIGFVVVWLTLVIFQQDTHEITLNPSFIVSLFNISLILFTGSYFWKLMLNAITKKRYLKITPQHYQFFLNIRRLSTILLILATYFYISTITSTAAMLTTIAYIFMWLEYINYFYIRLSYLSPREFVQLLKSKQTKSSQLRRAMLEYQERQL